MIHMGQINFRVKLLFVMFLCMAIWRCSRQKSTIVVSQSKDRTIIENHKIRAIFTRTDGIVSQEYYAKKDSDWVKVATAFIPSSVYPEDAVQLFNQDLGSYRYLSNSNLTDLKLIEKYFLFSRIRKSKSCTVMKEKQIDLIYLF